ncbi:hypothetical protein [Pararhodobacter marinus]|uniref:hypothetical protein n=1 Tax=Pararhodobacter marinus TaxID=2184063 RepID=UPI003517F9A4
MKKVTPLMRSISPTLAAGAIAGAAVLAGILAGAYDGQLLALASTAGIALALSFELALWSWTLLAGRARNNGVRSATVSTAQRRVGRTMARRSPLRVPMQKRTA